MQNLNTKNIDDYINQFPEDQMIALSHLRDIIKSIIPEAEECIHYQIPTFKYHGPLVGFGAFKNHCSFFVMSGSVLDDFKEELQGFKYSTGTIQFKTENPIPDELVKQIVLKRIAFAEAKQLTKKGK